MKIKSAHIFLAAASLATLTTLAGCGTNSSGELTGPGYDVNTLVNSPQVQSFTLTPPTSTLNAGSTLTMQALGSFSNGQTGNINSQLTWTSSNPNIASVSPTGVVFARLPGTVTITAGGLGNLASQTATVTVNPFIDRFFVSNAGSNSISVFATNSANGSVTAQRVISGGATGLNSPTQIAVNNQELFVANGGGGATDGGTVTIYYLQATGNAAPLRTIRSTAITGAAGLAIIGNELFVSNPTGSQISVFPTSAGNDGTTETAPVRTIVGGATLLNNPGQLANLNGSLLVANTGGASVLNFASSATGNAAPITRLTSSGASLLVTPTTVTVSGNSLFVGDTARGTINNFSLTNFNANPVNTNLAASTISGVTGFTSPSGSVASGSNLVVLDRTTSSLNTFPQSQNGNAAGSPITTSPGLNVPTSIVTAGSF